MFDLGVEPESCAVQVIPVPWEVTASYGRGTAQGPAAVLRASHQVDLYDFDFGEVWQDGIGLLAVDPRIAACAQSISDEGLVNRASADRTSYVEASVESVLTRGAIPAVLGGDHSCPLGLIRAMARRHSGLGILHIDAHADLRVAYQGFEESHASIMHNVLELEGVSHLVGVGWRDVCKEEIVRAQDDSRIVPFWDCHIARARLTGQPFSLIVDSIVSALPPQVHVSFDIDGLDPSLCPSTGTPVPGGLSFQEVAYLLRCVSEARTIVSFDLCEVAPGSDEWDANVGARVLYKLACAALSSR